MKNYLGGNIHVTWFDELVLRFLAINVTDLHFKNISKFVAPDSYKIQSVLRFLVTSRNFFTGDHIHHFFQEPLSMRPFTHCV